MKILSWNIRCFTSCVRNGWDGLSALKALMSEFELIVIYEVSKGVNGDRAVTDLVAALNAMPHSTRSYAGFWESTLGQGKEDNQVAVLYDTKIINVHNTTVTRRSTLIYPGGRFPVYFNVTEIANGNTEEFCAWHAPSPGANGGIIVQAFQGIQNNAQATDGTRLTGIIMGDFNGDLMPKAFGRGGYFKKIFQQNDIGTTLTASFSAASYLTTNHYDQFFVDKNWTTVKGQFIFNVIELIEKNDSVFKDIFKVYYSTPQKAYDFYYKHISDHLPVSLNVELP